MVTRYENLNTFSSTCSPQWTAGLFCCSFSSFDTWTALSTSLPSNDWFFTGLCVLLWWILTPLIDLQGRSYFGYLNYQSWTYTPVCISWSFMPSGWRLVLGTQVSCWGLYPCHLIRYCRAVMGPLWLMIFKHKFVFPLTSPRMNVHSTFRQEDITQKLQLTAARSEPPGDVCIDVVITFCVHFS